MKSPHRRLSRVLLSFAPLAATALVAACTTTSAPSPTEHSVTSGAALSTSTSVPRAGIMRPSRGAKRSALLHPPTASYAPTGGCTTPLSYYGGPIMASPNVVQVSWNDPGSSVASSIETYLTTWWPAIVSPQANYLSLLDQYSTVGLEGKDGAAGSNQTFAGSGNYGGLYRITPSAANQGATIDDTAIGPEIVAQINAGNLPAPQFDANGLSNTIYMVDFAPSVTTITMTFAGQTITSCSSFCGYHAGVEYSAGKYIYYGVLPDVTTGACASGCLPDGMDQDVGAVHSHELAEAITDAEIFLEQLSATSTDFVRPGAWDNINGGCGEIGDACAWPSEIGATMPTVTANGGTYYVQGLYSNAGSGSGPDCEWQGTGTTGGCTSNANCTNPLQPVCKNSACTGCASDTDCSGNAAGGACQPSGACGQCSATNATACVAPTPACNTTTGTCVACTSNSQCSGNTPICDATSNTCRACTALDCTSPTPVCATTGGNAGKCVVCTANSECSGNTPICDATTNTCRGCASNNDCAGQTNHACDVSTGVCVACVQNSDCSAGVCDTTTNSCVQCVNDSECSNPLPVCSSNACVACSGNSDCSTSTNGHVCVPSAGCVQCGTSSDCPNGGMCNTTTHTCSGGSGSSSGSSSGSGSGSSSGAGSSSGGGSGSGSGSGSSSGSASSSSGGGSGGGSGSSSSGSGSSSSGSGSGGSVDAGNEDGGDGGNGATGGGGGCSVGATGGSSSDAGWLGLFLVGAALTQRRRRA